TQFPRQVREIENLFITLADGCRLAARIWLPADAETKPVPAILEYLPYRKRDGTSERDQLTHPYFAGNGYACVRVDMRGSGESDGLLEDEYLKSEQDDCLEVLRWIAAQPWCTGKIGMIGISWGGFNGLQVAARRPPELAAVISLCSTDDRYADDIHYMGGCLLNDNLQWSSVMFAYMARSPDKALLGEAWREVWLNRLNHEPLLIAHWLKHQRRDASWKHGSICEDWSAITCPVYLVGGWADGYSNTIPRMLAHLQCPKKGLIGPWAHKYPHFAKPGPRIGFLQDALRWWDKWLKGIETGIMDEPQYRVWMEEPMPPRAYYEERPGRWVAEPSWPSPNIEAKSLHLASGARLTETQPPEIPVSYLSPQSVGVGCGAWCGFGIGPERPLDQRIDDGRSLCFDSEPLPERLEILGAPALHLEIAVDRPQAFVAVRLNEVTPDGASARITYGLLNLTHRRSHENPTAVSPGERLKVAVQLNDIAHAFAAGSRIRVSISTSYWPLVWPSPEPATLTVFTGASRLALPTRKPRAVDARLPAFPESEGARPLAKTYHRPSAGRRWIERDIGSGWATYFIEEDMGHFTIDHIGLKTDFVQREAYRIRDDDPLTAEIEISYAISIGHGDWRTRSLTRTVMRADKTHFILEASLDAYEGDQRIASRNWQERIARDMM
ncbi:MAG TPA: CocE/NonD family hydrolase, partial [Candidatus Udaeobacter sp.]|nr:CocE/NonD family hydrolase [Candidatus Udaeobacter sp.]